MSDAKRNIKTRQRVPGQVQVNPRDLEGKYEDTIKAAWKRATHTQVPGGEKGKHRWRRKPGQVGLKEFCRNLIAEGHPDAAIAKRFLHNKRVNTTVPPRGIGATRKKKGGGKKETAPTTTPEKRR